MKCDKCGKEIKPGEIYHIAVGIIKCLKCAEESDYTVSMDEVFDKIIKLEKK